MFKPAIVPQTPDKIIEDAMRLFFSQWKNLYRLAFIVGFVSILPNILIPALNSPDPDIELIGIQTFSDYLIFYFMLVIIFHNAMLLQLHQLMYGEEAEPLTELINKGFFKMLPMLLASFIFGLAIFLGLFALIVPGIFIAVRLFFHTPLIVIHDYKVIDSFKASFKLTNQNWWASFQILAIPLMAFLLGMVLLSGINYLLILMGIPAEGQLMNTIILILQFMLTAFVTPFLYAFMLVQLHNLQLIAALTSVDTPPDDEDFIA